MMVIHIIVQFQYGNLHKPHPWAVPSGLVVLLPSYTFSLTSPHRYPLISILYSTNEQH